MSSPASQDLAGLDQELARFHLSASELASLTEPQVGDVLTFAGDVDGWRAVAGELVMGGAVWAYDARRRRTRS